MQRDDPHLKDARLSLRVAMVEAADDSYIFSKSLASLQRNALAMERFQYAYGWLTQWAKLTVLYSAPPIAAGIHRNPEEWHRNLEEWHWNPQESTGMAPESTGMALESTGMALESAEIYRNGTRIQ